MGKNFYSMASAAKELAKQPKCAVPVFFLGVVADGAVGKYILDGKPVKDILIWLWDTVSTITDLPLVELAMIGLAIWLFAQGVGQVIKHQEALEIQQLRDAKALVENAKAIENQAAEQIKPFLRIQQAFVLWFAAEEKYRQINDMACRLRNSVDCILRQAKDRNQPGCWDLHTERSLQNGIRSFNLEIKQMGHYGLPLDGVPELVADDKIEATSHRIFAIIEADMVVLTSRLAEQRQALARMHHNG